MVVNPGDSIHEGAKVKIAAKEKPHDGKSAAFVANRLVPLEARLDSRHPKANRLALLLAVTQAVAPASVQRPASADAAAGLASIIRRAFMT